MDQLSFELEVEIRQEYKNISKHKRKLMPINELLLDKDEVFVVDEFFD